MTKKKKPVVRVVAPTVKQAKGPNKIAIVGTSPHRAHAPYDDKTWEIWGIGTWVEEVRRWDRWWEIHDFATFKEPYDAHLKYLRESGKPVYVDHPTEKMPKGIPYPREYLIERFGGSYFFTSSVNFMQAMAINHLAGLPPGQPRVLGMWGVDMATHDEFKGQKPGCKHFMVIAKLMGIELVIAEGSDLLVEPAAYPAKPSLLQIKIKSRQAEIVRVSAQKRKALELAQLEFAHMEGMRYENQYFVDNWTEERGT